MDYLRSRFSDTSEILFEGLARLMGLAVPVQLHLHNSPENQTAQSFYIFLNPPSELLNNSAKQDTSLFVEEKQNLFRDEADEIQRWGNMLCDLPIKTIASFDVVPLSGWATSGINALLNTAKSRSGGPLGRASKPDVFVVTSRIISAAKVVLRWTSKLEVYSESSDLRRLLLSLNVSHLEDSIHPVLRDKLADLQTVARDQGNDTL